MGRLRIENARDRVVIYGDVDIRRDREGFEAATRLKQLFDAVVAELGVSDDLPEKVEDRELVFRRNPFRGEKDQGDG